jgi:hypothetical protein
LIIADSPKKRNGSKEQSSQTSLGVGLIGLVRQVKSLTRSLRRFDCGALIAAL